MILRICATCLFRKECGPSSSCDFWSPSTAYEEIILDEIIEQRRQEFYREWWAYIKEDD